jgi:hypothetical protein
MKFSIVTPSFRNSNWFKPCIAAVADQQGVELEHIVQDSCSDDGTQDGMPRDRRVKAFIEKDNGMYDAVNHSYRRAQGRPSFLKRIPKSMSRWPAPSPAPSGRRPLFVEANQLFHLHVVKPGKAGSV